MGDDGFYNYLRANFVPDISFEEACELKAQFFAGYPDMARWQDEYARHTREQGYTQTVAGGRWRWKWQAQEPEDVDENAPFYADTISGFRGAISADPMRIRRKRFARNVPRRFCYERRMPNLGGYGDWPFARQSSSVRHTPLPG
jgi:hypothetical protein